MNLRSFVGLPLAALISACTTPMPTMMDADFDAPDATVIMESGTIDRPDVPNGDVTDVTDVPNNDVPNNDVPNNDVPNNDVPNNDVPENDVPNNDVPNVDVPNVMDVPNGDVADVPNGMDVPNPITDTGVCPMGTMACGMMGCVNLQTSNANCGACGNACPANQMCVSGACRLGCPMPNTICGGGAMMTCVNTSIDPSHCGACGNACVLANATPFCGSGTCGVAACSIGFGNCDLNAANGCETNTNTSVAHCGGCGMACVFANGTPSCNAGSCTLASCNAGFANCDMNAANGCETNTNTSAAHCGACGNACPANQMCVSGACRLGCPMPNTICGGGAMMTCVNTSIDPSHCGACGNTCVLANATPFCGSGMCGVAACSVGFDNCDMNAANGCETNTNTSVAHCGGCRIACPAVANGTAGCSMGTCEPMCNAGFERLGATCITAGVFPRPISPLSLGNVSLRRPTLRWALPAGTDGALVDLCRDRACTMVIESIRAVGTSARPTLALPANSVVFWRLRATLGMATSVNFSPTWLFHVPATDNSGNVDTSANAHLDVNGDGFDDVVIGASGADPGGRVNAGTASVFHGSAGGIPMAPDRVLEGVAAGDAFGTSVASAGDVNGDGFGDLVVGANLADPGGRVNAGTASVFHGSAVGIAMAPARVLEGVASNDQFGTSVASAGDVNGDGFGDLVIGANFADPGGRVPMRTGTASVFHGSAGGIPMAPARVLGSVDDGDQFGTSVASAGDVNGDGFGDLVIGAHRAFSFGRLQAGTASVFHGSAVGIPMAPVGVLEGVAANDAFGYSVASAGDVNGDGFGDLVIGAIGARPGGRSNAGTASVFHGSAVGIPMAPARVLEGVAVNDFFGNSVASAGDVNGDGFGDLVIGAYQFRNPLVRPGTASVYHGSAGGIPMAPASVLAGVSPGGQFGYSVSSAGDVNGDGFGDLVIGAQFASPGGRMSAGTASVFHGNAGGIPMAPASVVEGAAANDNFGFSVASAGDVHGRRRDRTASFWLELTANQHLGTERPNRA